MEEYRNGIILAFVGLYMALCVGVGVWALRRTKSAHDFFMAGRDLGIFVTGLAVFSSTLSGFGFVGGPGLVYRMGISSMWMVVCASIGYCISFYLLGKRIRVFAEVREPVSLPDAIGVRYNSNTTRLLSAIAIILGVLGYLATQILAMATVLQDIMQRSFGSFSIEMAVFVSCAILVFYCVTGGIIAGVYTDLVQGAVMMIAAVLVFFAAANSFPDGFTGISETLMRDDPESISPWGTLGMLGCLSWFFLFAMGGAGQPHVITKLMMNKNVRDARNILPVSALSYGVAALLWLSIGIAMRALVLSGGHPELATPDAAAPQFLQNYAHPILAGVVFAGLFAAIMSTADSFLNIGAAAVVHDIPTALRGRSLANELLWARISTVILAAVAAFFALTTGVWRPSPDLVALMGAFGWGTFAAALVPTVAIGFNWKRATATAANVAILSSLIVNFGIKLLNINVPYGIDGGFIALVLSLTLFFGISFLSEPPELAADVQAAIDL